MVGRGSRPNEHLLTLDVLQLVYYYLLMTIGALNTTKSVSQTEKVTPGMLEIEIVFLIIYWLATIVILIYVNLVTLRINSSNRYAKKSIYLLIFIVNV